MYLCRGGLKLNWENVLTLRLLGCLKKCLKLERTFVAYDLWQTVRDD